jgi:hypothetical protein
MNKIYLRLKKRISILLDDGWWSLDQDDMIVLQKVGIRTTELNEPHSPTKYIKSDCYLTSAIEYKNIKNYVDIMKDKNLEIEYHMKWQECCAIDSIIKISSDSPYYSTSKVSTYSEMIESGYLKSFDVFDDVSLQYNREEKLNELIKD